MSRVDRSAGALVTSFAAGLFTTSLPFWLLGSGQLHGFGLPLPVSALMFVCPGVVATVLAAREAGRAGALRLWRRSVDVTAARHARSSGMAALVLPALVLVGSLFAHGSAALTSPWMPLTSVAVLVVVYLVAALVEEVGWTACRCHREASVTTPSTSSVKTTRSTVSRSAASGTSARMPWRLRACR